jgi:hypothetical protein
MNRPECENKQLNSLREYLIDNLPDLEEGSAVCWPYLKDHFLETAQVTDPKKGYISYSPANQSFPTEIAAASSIIGLSIIQRIYQGPLVTVGIPDSGRYWASNMNPLAVFKGIRMEMVAARSDGRIPGAWVDPVEIQPSSSFTTGESETPFAVHPAIKNSPVAVIIDDYCASGRMAKDSIEALLREGIEVAGYVVFVEKAFQGGIRVVHQECQIPCAAVLSVEKISERGVERLREGIHTLGID